VSDTVTEEPEPTAPSPTDEPHVDAQDESESLLASFLAYLGFSAEDRKPLVITIVGTVAAAGISALLAAAAIGIYHYLSRQHPPLTEKDALGGIFFALEALVIPGSGLLYLRRKYRGRVVGRIAGSVRTVLLVVCFFVAAVCLVDVLGAVVGVN